MDVARITAPAFVVQLVNDVYSWSQSAHKNPLGYQVSSPDIWENSAVFISWLEAKKGQNGSIDPENYLPAWLRPINRGLAELRCTANELWLAIDLKHTSRNHIKEFCDRTGHSRHKYFECLDRGYWYLAGMVNSELDRERKTGT